MACLRLVTFRPLRPLRSVPFFRRCITLLTDFCAFFPYLAMRPPRCWPIDRLVSGASNEGATDVRRTLAEGLR